ncbi:bifunctional phosphopantothenoylcysteine decarboxylase/phosphopantothenate--cysteine ligase CoaBC [Candidatus Woesebacteria bacterium]|nr:bifunctional phosphopantothenoylcysteine decarboxylase/phosphopantothenate--cysteine ligase CoaBC [Candidatus Woesebacteria bacterium]
MKIVLGISSGIAAYKIPELVKKLIKNGHDVQVIMTPKSAYLVDRKELETQTGNNVFIDLFNEHFSRETILKERKVDHIELAKQADLVVIAPATANTLANLAYGKADDFLTTTVLATRAPILVCPSMNDQMWLHVAVQENIRKIDSYGYTVMTPESGSLACGTEGIGRLPAIDKILNKIEAMLIYKALLKGKKIIVTSGASIEYIDDARIMTNRSVGKMGSAIAKECYTRGADVVLLRAESSLPLYQPIKQYTFRTATDLENLLSMHTPKVNIVIHTAAVSDFTVDKIAGKIDSTKELTLSLKPSEKIINKLKKWNPNIRLIAFKAISGSLQQNIEKIHKVLQDSRADYIVVNDISRPDIGFESDENEVNIIDKMGNQKKIGKMSKQEIAGKILDHLSFTSLDSRLQGNDTNIL